MGKTPTEPGRKMGKRRRSTIWKKSGEGAQDAYETTRGGMRELQDQARDGESKTTSHGERKKKKRADQPIKESNSLWAVEIQKRGEGGNRTIEEKDVTN